jgi:Type III flagellar switch regulator (C-ring) FliN C-term
MVETAQDARHPFTAELIRSKGVNLSQQLEILKPFAEILAEQVGAMLSEIGGIAVKVSVAAAKTEKLMPHFQAEAGFNIVAETGTVCCWSKSDIEFDNILCEICLGGSGGSDRDATSDRPATAFDKKLRAFINEKITLAAVYALAEIGEQKGLEVQARPRVAPRKAEGVLLCYNIQLLINVFDNACEYDLYLGFEECLKLIGGVLSLAKPVPNLASELMEKTLFAVEVYLKPDVVDVRQILNLMPGDVLKLNVAASTPVELRLNGQRLSYGKLSFGAAGGSVRLLGEVPGLQVGAFQQNNHAVAD